MNINQELLELEKSINNIKDEEKEEIYSFINEMKNNEQDTSIIIEKDINIEVAAKNIINNNELKSIDNCIIQIVCNTDTSLYQIENVIEQIKLNLKDKANIYYVVNNPNSDIKESAVKIFFKKN